MKLRLQCDAASCSAEEEIEVGLSKKQQDKLSSFIREHGEFHTIIST